VCDHHPEIIEEGGKLGWEWIGHNQTNALRLTEMDPAAERAAVRATIDSAARPAKLTVPCLALEAFADAVPKANRSSSRDLCRPTGAAGGFFHRIGRFMRESIRGLARYQTFRPVMA
jgi:hypothetical protein